MANELDGNVTGGMLRDIFCFEMTTALATCARCGQTDPLGALPTYALKMGAVVRCGACDAALLRLTHLKGQYWIDLRGLRVLRVKDGA